MSGGELLRAAVLVPLQVDAEGRRLVTLIQRPHGSFPHQGQVALPGGRFDPERDDSLLATALREAEEEVGLAPAAITVLGALAEQWTLSSNYVVSPFVGRVPHPYPFRADRREVEEIFTVPLEVLADEEKRESMHWEYAGAGYDVPCVRVGRFVVWGMTLCVIDDFLAALKAGEFAADGSSP